ncbi:L,D-transpeptidase family protein [Rhabdonatronobacter sediminivivens]|nr:L,D-transpeptidase family protein [Rhabdonatronobacter sediminivivens]
MVRMAVSAAGMRRFFGGMAVAALLALSPAQGQAQQFSAYKQALAEGVAEDRRLSAFYRDHGYQPLWTGPGDEIRRRALITAISRAADHGLPVARYDLDGLLAAFDAVETERDRGFLEAQVSETFLRFARDLTSGVLTPSRVDSDIVRTLPRPDPETLLRDFAAAEPVSFIRNLAPSAPEYARLFRAKRNLEAVIAQGGWGPTVPVSSLSPGDSGAGVVALRNRLIAMGYLHRTAVASYDAAVQSAVQRFQINHGLEADGVAGPATLRALNTPPEERLQSVVVAMERERWLNIERGDRHIWVNLADFSSRIVDFDEVTFETVSIIGARNSDQRTPEFSEDMTYLEINPDWTLPRSILARSYWGALSAGGAQHLQILDARGRQVPRSAIDFSRYTPRNFPFNVRQPPGPTNPLGTVKFMFPNPWAIYLHDTPARSLFNTQVLTHSSGCIRLSDPEEFAYELLGRQTDDPQGLFHRTRNSGQQTRIFLDTPVPTHLVYRTAFTDARGALNFRDDVYDRDAAIFRALVNAGVEMPGVRS